MIGTKGTLIATICAAATIMSLNAAAQNGTPRSQSPSSTNLSSQGQDPGAGINSDKTLEIGRRAVPSAEATANQADSVPGDSVPDSGNLGNATEQALPPVPTSGPPLSMLAGPSTPRQPLPYLGISVQRIESHATARRDIDGLEIVSVDAASPAEHAGLRGRGGMTKLGASGATAGALMAPLDIALMPLLKKTGQLGQSGDLIVAIDDRRVNSELDLQTALTEARPGDTIYLTVMRLAGDNSHKTIKIPVKLGTAAGVP